MNNLTPQPNTQTEGPSNWAAFQASLPAEAEGDRAPFFPLKDIPSGKKVAVNITGGPHFAGFQGQYSLVELDVKHEGSPYRLCVSGSRLARAIADLAPGVGDTIALTPTGDGKARVWAVRLA